MRIINVDKCTSKPSHTDHKVPRPSDNIIVMDLINKECNNQPEIIKSIDKKYVTNICDLVISTNIINSISNNLDNQDNIDNIDNIDVQNNKLPLLNQSSNNQNTNKIIDISINNLDNKLNNKLDELDSFDRIDNSLGNNNLLNNDMYDIIKIIK